MKRVFVLLFFLSACRLFASDMIDPLSDASSWNIQNDMNASSTCTAVTDSSVPALKLATAFSNGQWSEINKVFTGENFTNAVSAPFISFWYKAVGGGVNNKITFGIQNTNETIAATIIPDNQWHHVLVNLTQSVFRGGLSVVSAMKFVVNGAGAGTVTFDKLELYTNNAPVRTVDDLESSSAHSGWQIGSDKANQISLSTVPGMDGNALMITYSILSSPTWGVVLYRSFTLNLSSADYFQFKFKSCGTSVDDLQVRLADSKDWTNISVTFGRNFNNLIGNSCDWITLIVRPQDLYYISSDNPLKRMSLNINQISKISFRANRANNAVSASFLISGLEWGNKFSKADLTTATHPIFTELMLDHNPISPDGDGWQDKVTFTYKINKAASIKMFVYDLRGVLIRQIDAGKDIPRLRSPFFLGWIR